jgi:cytochrome b pre-mRNA-processing protein 3
MPWFAKAKLRRDAEAFYHRVVERARDPAFYTQAHVPDSVDGRFDMVALHMALMLDQLETQRPGADRLITALIEVFIDDMDESMREMGVGDLSVGKHVKNATSALLGRLSAYRTGDPETFRAALTRNVYRGALPDPAHVQRLEALAADSRAAFAA